MHSLDIDTVAMTLDVAKYVIDRITRISPDLGKPRTAEELHEALGETITGDGIGGERAFELFREELVRATVPIDHPRHLAFVPASPTRAAVLFDLVTSASSIHAAYWMEGGGAIFAECEAMRWLVSLTGMREPAFGVFTSGGTAANLSALVAARETWLRRRDEGAPHRRGLIICSRQAHASVESMAGVMDVELRVVETVERLEGVAVERVLADLTPLERERLFAVVATAGTTNAGIIDDLPGVAAACRRAGVWLHVDAAYGGGALASPKLRPLFAGIELADSVTIDPHKWLFVPYDCGAVLYRDPELARLAHTQNANYLDIFKDPAYRGFNPADYQIQLTRRARGLPLWFSLAMHGTDKYAWGVERGCELARHAAALVAERDYLEQVRPVGLSVILFRRIGWGHADYVEWTRRHHAAGDFLVAPTTWRRADGTDETVARFCFISPHTTEEDVAMILATMAD